MKISNSFKLKLKQFGKTIKFAIDVDRRTFFGKALSQLIQIPVPIVQAYLAKLIMDQISLGIKTGHSDAPLIYKYVFFEFLILFVNSVISAWQKKTNFTYREKMELAYETIVFEKVQRVSFAAIEDTDTQNKMYEVKNRSHNIESMLSDLFSLIQGVSVLISFLGVLITLNVWICLTLVVITFISFLSNHRYSKEKVASFKKSRSTNRLKWHLQYMFIEPFYTKETKALDVESKLLSQYQSHSKIIFDRDLIINQKQALRQTVLDNISNLSYYLSYAWVVWLTINNKITLGDLTMFVLLFKQTESSLTSIFQSLISFIEENDKMETYYNFLNLPEVHTVPLPEDEFLMVLSNPIIEFKNVFFTYMNGKDVLKDLSFKLQPGEKIALVGENGAGKSTIIKLLCGLYHPTSGEIHIGGVNLDKFSRSQIKSLMGIVFQDFAKFPASFKENIVIAEKDVTSSSYEKSLELSGANKVKEEMGGNDNQMLNKALFEEGSELSGGQWQKIALARAFVQNGKVVILDEPTSAIDAKQEYEIFKKFQELTKGKTSILVSHRFSTVRIAQRIIFLENGSIIEDGSHEELLRLNGKYAQMFNLQAEGYR